MRQRQKERCNHCFEKQMMTKYSVEILATTRKKEYREIHLSHIIQTIFNKRLQLQDDIRLHKV